MFDWIETAAARLSERINDLLLPFAEKLEGYVWTWPNDVVSFIPPLLIVLLLGTGLYVTLRLAFVQVRGFRHALDITRGLYDDPSDTGDLIHFQALTTALSATVGIGNIAGVAIAIRLGGPGALFWMWITAFFGMALKYAECTLAIVHRKVHRDGSVSGGPMYYIEQGLGGSWKWLAMIFAACTAISSFGGGCMNQSNTLAAAVKDSFGIPTVFSGLIFATVVALVIIGGIRRIGKVTAILAPGMAAMYVAAALVILVLYIGSIPGAIALILQQAFAPEPLVGGAAGSFFITLLWGIRRGLFSNEAGQGSAPIAHAAAKTDEPVREGLVASLGPFIDTLVICTLTGLVIVTTGVYKDKFESSYPLSGVEAVLAGSATDSQLLELRAARDARGASSIQVVNGRPVDATLVQLDATIEDVRLIGADDLPWNGTLNVAVDGLLTTGNGGSSPEVKGRGLLTGVLLTSQAFRRALGGGPGGLLVTLAVILFAVSTGISWSYYGDRATEYLLGSWAIRYYRWIFIFFFFLGAILPLKAVWVYGDVALGLMTLPNLIGLIFLSGTVAKLTKEYFGRTHTPYRQTHRN